MSRPLRVDFPGARHHVYNRTARRRRVFRRAEDLALFLGLLAELPGRFSTRVHGWALGSNHFHVLLDAPDGRLPAVMAWLGGTFARQMNAAHGWDGPLFRGRYLSRVVRDDVAWQQALALVHLDPVAARLVPHPDRSTWTSHRAYAGLDPAPPWLSRDGLLALYGSEAGYRAALDSLASGRTALPTDLDADRLWRAQDLAADPSAGAATPTSVLTPDLALAQVAAIAGVSVPSLVIPRRGRAGNVARTLAAWWLGRAAAQTRAQIAEILGMSPLAVAGASHRVRTAQGGLAAWRDGLLSAGWQPPATSQNPPDTWSQP